MTLDDLLARAEIHDVVLRYCRGIDRLDPDLVRSCYHPGATDEHGSFTGDVEAYVAWAFGLLGKYDATQHLVANHLVDFPEGGAGAGRAVAETAGVAVHVTAGGSPARAPAVRARIIKPLVSMRRVTCHSRSGSEPTTAPHRRGSVYLLPVSALGRRHFSPSATVSSPGRGPSPSTRRRTGR